MLDRKPLIAFDHPRRGDLPPPALSRLPPPLFAPALRPSRGKVCVALQKKTLSGYKICAFSHEKNLDFFIDLCYNLVLKYKI